MKPPRTGAQQSRAAWTMLAAVPIVFWSSYLLLGQSPSGSLSIVSGYDENYLAVGESASVTLEGLVPDDPELQEEWEKRGPFWDWDWTPPANLTVTPTAPPTRSGQQQTISGSSAVPGKYELAVSATGFREKRLPPSETWERYADKSGSRTIRFYVFRVSINSLSPENYLRLGDDLTVTYTVRDASSVTFDSMQLLVYNASDTLVYKRTDLEKEFGTYTTTWEAAKWNQSPHSGAYANPNNGPYRIFVLGTIRSTECWSWEHTIDTKFVITADVKDIGPVGPDGSEAAGLADLASAFSVRLVKGGDSRTISGSGITFADITDGKHVNVDASALNSLPDGLWSVQLNARDEIGNFADPSWNVTLY